MHAKAFDNEGYLPPDRALRASDRVRFTPSFAVAMPREYCCGSATDSLPMPGPAGRHLGKSRYRPSFTFHRQEFMIGVIPVVATRKSGTLSGIVRL